MRKDWEYKKLGEVCETSSGGTPSKTYTEYYENGTIPWLRSGEVSQGYIYDAEIYISELGLNKSSAKIFPKGTVLIAMYGATVGEVGILCNPMCTNQAICGVLPNDLYNSEFLRYVLLSHKDKYLSLAIGGAQPNISQQIIKNTLIPLIDKSTQLSIVAELDKINELIQLKKQQLEDYDQLAQSIFHEMFGDPVENEKGWEVTIVAELDKINELIQLKKQQLEDYDQLAQSIFHEMFGDPVENEKGWEVKKLGEIALEKMSYGSGASAVPYNQKIRYIRITDIDELGCLKKDIVSPNICEDKYLLSDGDILFARSGATVGKTFLFKSTYGSCIYAGYLIRLRPNTQIVIPEYVYHYTKTHYYRSFIESNQRVVAQPNINAQQYSSLKLPLPPLPLQQQFAARIEAIERQKQQVSETIKDLETLLASRMQYWFD